MLETLTTQPPKLLLDLLLNVPGVISSTGTNVVVQGIVLDSRKVKPGDLFVALQGGSSDGHRYIPSAVQRGAGAVVGTQVMPGLPVPYVQVEDSRLALAFLSAAYYDFPARKMTMIGVTGTDGKTTTSNLIFQILQAAGFKVGMISTVNAVIGDQTLDTGFHVTTPESPDVQRYLAHMAAAGLTHAVLETTSHGLAQHRVAACDFDLGVVTNITHEHLDYHGSYAAYREAKARLFVGLEKTPEKPFHPARGAVLNFDDCSYDYLSAVTGVHQVSYGVETPANVRAEQVHLRPGGMEFLAVTSKYQIPIVSHLEGAYNVSNCLAAIALAVELMAVSPTAAQRGIYSLGGVPGRMERIDLGQDFGAIVDFAHTPNALYRALEAVRPITAGRVIAVIGSAGLRDREKRRLMAEVSAQYADLTILTAEDPRTESLTGILEEMAAGMVAHKAKEDENFWRIPDRREALRKAVRLARHGDTVIACGKGHEQSMCFGEVEYSWDDRIAMRAALAELLDVPGPEMPYLPEQV